MVSIIVLIKHIVDGCCETTDARRLRFADDDSSRHSAQLVVKTLRSRRDFHFADDQLRNRIAVIRRNRRCVHERITLVDFTTRWLHDGNRRAIFSAVNCLDCAEFSVAIRIGSWLKLFGSQMPVTDRHLLNAPGCRFKHCDSCCDPAGRQRLLETVDWATAAKHHGVPGREQLPTVILNRNHGSVGFALQIYHSMISEQLRVSGCLQKFRLETSQHLLVNRSTVDTRHLTRGRRLLCRLNEFG
ncbi:hypothetical protein KQX54_010739 [Cotesia glomerata]|uniref:Uncharacterized protein n=1 Tax=Cotesia glomerata TaxID=32391 RepID=A0AAV7HTJ2_COTGL|nr:hypothetical protein KQX54_010739 [Cotesia glomerata]